MSRRLADYDRALFGGPAVDVQRLAGLSFHGIPDGGELRALCWQILTGHLPADRRQWPHARAAARREYARILASVAQGEHDAHVARRLRAQIRADTERTQPDIALFRSRCDGARCIGRTGRRGAVDARHTLDGKIAAALADPQHSIDGPVAGSGCGAWLRDPPKTHADVLARILYVYSRSSPGTGYVQGMNEVLAPIYYVLATVQADCEADAFHLLVRVLSGAHRDMFVSAMDAIQPPALARRSSDVRPDPWRETGGLQGILRHWWDDYVRPTDEQLWARLDGLGLRPEHFAVRWLLAAGAREFALPDVLVLWDALMANRARLAAAAARGPTPLPCEVARALNPQPHPAPAYTAVRAPVGRLRCEVRVPVGASGDDEDSTHLGFLFDVLTAVLLALRPRLLRLSLDGCLALLQRLPRDAAELDPRRLVDDALRRRARRAARRAVRACHAVLGAVPRETPPPACTASLAPLLSPHATPVGIAAGAPATPKAGVSRLVGRLAASLGLLDSTPAVHAADCLLLAIPARLHGPSPPAKQQSPRVDVLEVAAFDPHALVASVRLLGGCCALRPALAGVQRAAQRDFIVCLAAPTKRPLPSPRRVPSDSAGSASSSSTIAGDDEGGSAGFSKAVTSPPHV
ncbi:hypothetical protein IWQ57_000567 [Coemansia nantahalensis]|uniref:Uncharacterized protein n=1 Tax=Coemansia nantahalensis TaxID=2789366 RepID=A0ACC1K853_9FUNG|nr:hypothetical protein IWQ57_000567 [Coemansia nantahalensis]